MSTYSSLLLLFGLFCLIQSTQANLQEVQKVSTRTLTIKAQSYVSISPDSVDLWYRMQTETSDCSIEVSIYDASGALQTQADFKDTVVLVEAGQTMILTNNYLLQEVDVKLSSAVHESSLDNSDDVLVALLLIGGGAAVCLILTCGLCCCFCPTSCCSNTQVVHANLSSFSRDPTPKKNGKHVLLQPMEEKSLDLEDQV